MTESPAARTVEIVEVDAARPSVTGRLAFPVRINGEIVAKIVVARAGRYTALTLRGLPIVRSTRYDFARRAVVAAWTDGEI